MAHRIDFGSARRKQLQAAGVLFMLCLPAPSEAVSLTLPERCLEAPVDVSAESADDRRFACVAAADALQLLGHCGISLRRSLRIDMVKEVRHPLSGPIFGLFDVKEEKILVAEYASIPALVSSTPYSDLPPRDFYRSLIVHEVVHGVLHQNYRRKPMSHAAYEYPAYALQIESLSADVRDRFLGSFEQSALGPDSNLFNDAVLFFDPYFFAARAYRHFKASANGCGHLSALLDGEVAFVAPPN